MAQSRRNRAVAADVQEGNHSVPEGFWDEVLRFGEVCEEPSLTGWDRGSDLERLQGAWITVAGQRQAELLFSGHHVTMHLGDGRIYMGTFTLGAPGRVASLDILVEEGPEKHRGLPVHCIYELDGDTLRWCNASPGRVEPPTAFDEHNPHLLCLMFRREHRANVR